MKLTITIEVDDLSDGGTVKIDRPARVIEADVTPRPKQGQIQEGFAPEEEEVPPDEELVAEEVEPEDPKASASRSVTKREASVRRGLKVFFYALFGQLLAFGGAIAASVAGLANVPIEVAALVGFVISGFAAAIHKAINWQDAIGEETPEPEIMPVPQLSRRGNANVGPDV